MDIVEAVMSVYSKVFQQCKDVATDLEGDTIEQTCRNIFEYVNANVTYREDPPGDQWVKSPARLVKDGFGDCKSYSILVNSILRCLGIKHCFRFVAYDTGDFTHVYPIAFDGQKLIIIDVVAYVLKGTPFNNEIAYNHKKDIIMNGTRIAYLGGVGLSPAMAALALLPGLPGVGSLKEISLYKANKTSLKVNELEVCSIIDLYNEKTGLLINPNRECDYNTIEIYYVALNLIGEYGSNAANLELSGLVLAEFINNGSFEVSFDSANSRAPYFDNLYTQIKNAISERINNVGYYTKEFTSSVKDFIEWWRNTVLSQNFYPEKISGIGNTADDWGTQIKQAAPFFLYSTQASTVKFNKSDAERKHKKQLEIINEIKSKNTGLSSAAIDNVVRSGIIAQTGLEPEHVIAIIAAHGQGKSISGIGSADIFDTYYQNALNEGLISQDTYNKYVSTASTTTPAQKTSTLSSAIDTLNSTSSLLNTTAQTIQKISNVFGWSGTPATASNLKNYTAKSSDWTSSLIIPVVGGAAIAFGAFKLLKNRKNGKNTKGRKR